MLSLDEHWRGGASSRTHTRRRHMGPRRRASRSLRGRVRRCPCADPAFRAATPGQRRGCVQNTKSVRVELLSVAGIAIGEATSGSPSTLAIPKSSTRATGWCSPGSPTRKTFAGLRSRWITPAACASASAWMTWIAVRAHSAVRPQQPVEARALDVLHHQKRARARQ